jgi:FkbM family methyltransferase
MPVRPLHDALFHYYCEFDAEALLQRHHAVDQIAEPGIIRNFLGTRIEPAVYPTILAAKGGTVEPIPNPGNWHADIAEWASALRSVEKAQDTYRIIELGCGWGCWITNMGVAARGRGLEVDLVGIEGDLHHLENARRTLALNGFGPDAFRLYHGVAAARPGKAIFPRPGAGQSHFGAAPVFDPGRAALRAAATSPDVQVVDCLTLDTLAKGKPVDLLHIDIQGGEADFVEGNTGAMARLVRRVLIGTHSREIEGRLCGHFLKLGWRLEMERPAIAPVSAGRPVIRIDGVQLWANPASEPTEPAVGDRAGVQT